MKEGIPFSSCLGKDIERFLDHRKSSINSRYFGKQIYYMHDFDDYLVSIDYKQGEEITEELVTTWIFSHDLADRTIEAYAGALRFFLKFYRAFAAKNQNIFIPGYYCGEYQYFPYIFSDDEMNAIYNEIDNYDGSHPNNTLPYIKYELPLIIRLLASSGFRINELVNVSMQDVSLSDGIFTMKETKNNRQRLVPLSDSMAELVRKYCEVMHLSEKTDVPLFPRRQYEEYLLWYDVYSRFKSVLVRLSIRQKEPYVKTRGPCLHCLRHRFVLKAIQKLLAEGIDLDTALPYLSVYIGHANWKQTESYLKFFADLFPDELDKFDDATKDIFPNDNIWDEWT